MVAENVRIHPNYGSNQNAYDFAILEIPDLSTVSSYKQYRYHQVISRLNPTVASTATMLHVSQQSMLPTVEPVGPVDGVLSDLVGGCLRNKKKLAFILWTMNIGEYILAL